MIEIQMTPAQFKAAAQKLKNEQQLIITGNCGTLSKNGCAAQYDYDGATLTVHLTKKPMLIPKSYVENELRAWLVGT